MHSRVRLCQNLVRSYKITIRSCFREEARTFSVCPIDINCKFCHRLWIQEFECDIQTDFLQGSWFADGFSFQQFYRLPLISSLAPSEAIDLHFLCATPYPKKIIFSPLFLKRNSNSIVNRTKGSHVCHFCDWQWNCCSVSKREEKI